MAKVSTPRDIHAELFDPDGMESARAALAREFDWFIHETGLVRLGSVQEGGLRRQHLPTSLDVPVADEQGFLLGRRRIVCLHPMGARLVPHGSQSGPRIKLAIEASNLPLHVGIDWSYSGCWGLARLLRDQDPTRPACEIFLEIAKRRGSIASYEDISSAKLQVWCKGNDEKDPATWLALDKASKDEVVAV